MVRRHRTRTGLALAVVIAALAAPSASALEADRFLGPQPSEAAPEGATAPSHVRIVEVPASSGFDWADAGIGAGVAFATLGVGAAVVVRNRRHSVRPATTT